MFDNISLIEILFILCQYLLQAIDTRAISTEKAVEFCKNFVKLRFTFFRKYLLLLEEFFVCSWSGVY